MRHIIFTAPHTNISGGIKVIGMLAQLCSAHYKVTVVVNHLSDPKLTWLFGGGASSLRFNLVQRGNPAVYNNADCIIEFMDNTLDTSIQVPRILLMQGFNNTSKECTNLTFPFKAVIATSKWLADLAIERGHKNVFIVPPGIQDNFVTCGEKVFSDRIVIGSLQHRFTLKNANSFISMINSYGKSSPVSFSLLFLASSVPELRVSPQFGCDWRVAPRQELLPRIYASCSVWVSPSLREGFGLTTIEAMACGVPTIWVRSGGLDAYMVDGENCLIVEHTCFPTIWQNILRVVEDKELAKKMSVNGQKTAQQFTWEKCFQSFHDVVQKTIGGV